MEAVKDAHSTFDRNELTVAHIIQHHNDILSSDEFIQLAATHEIDFELLK